MVSLLVESWTWWSLSAVVLIGRIAARWVHFGTYKKLQLDDYIIVLAFCFYTSEVETINIVSKTKTNLLPPGYLNRHSISPAEKREREFGSKMVLVVEQSACSTIWLIKACLLIMYHRITRSSFRAQNIAIKCTMVYVAVGFLVMEILYFGVWCQPFHWYWAVPTPNPDQCAAAIHHLITNAVLNISSDLAMLAIALPMFLRTNLPALRKAVLTSVFGLGAFVIVCAVLNKYYSFTQPFGSEWTFWYVREASTAMLVANLPFTWNLIRKVLGIQRFDAKDTSMHTATMSSDMHLSKKSLSAKIKEHWSGKHSTGSGDLEKNRASDSSSNDHDQKLQPPDDLSPTSLREEYPRKASLQRLGIALSNNHGLITSKLEAEAMADLPSEDEDEGEPSPPIEGEAKEPINQGRASTTSLQQTSAGAEEFASGNSTQTKPAPRPNTATRGTTPYDERVNITHTTASVDPEKTSIQEFMT